MIVQVLSLISSMESYCILRSSDMESNSVALCIYHICWSYLIYSIKVLATIMPWYININYLCTCTTIDLHRSGMTHVVLPYHPQQCFMNWKYIYWEDTDGKKYGKKCSNYHLGGGWGSDGSCVGKGKKGIGYHIFFKHGYTTVFDVIITETDSMTYQGTPTNEIFGIRDKNNKDNYLEVSFVTYDISHL